MFCISGCLLQAGNFIHSDVVTLTIQLITQTSSLHAYSVQRLFSALLTGYAQQPLAQIACWCVGEYGDQLFSVSVVDDGQEPLQVAGLVGFLARLFSLRLVSGDFPLPSSLAGVPASYFLSAHPVQFEGLALSLFHHISIGLLTAAS